MAGIYRAVGDVTAGTQLRGKRPPFQVAFPFLLSTGAARVLSTGAFTEHLPLFVIELVLHAR